MAISVVQTTGLYRANTFGWGTLNVTTTGGNTLFLVMAAHTLNVNWLPSHVADNVGNVWTMLRSAQGGVAGGTTQSSVSVWMCSNARAVSKINFSWCNVTDSTGMSVRMFEVSGLTNVSPLDTTGILVTSGTTATLSMTTASSSTFCLAALVQAQIANTVSHTADSWTTQSELSGTEANDYDDDLRLNTAYLIAGSAGAKSTTWTGSATTDWAGVIIAVKGGSTVTTNPNPNWPQLTTKVAFGQPPNASGFGTYNYSTDISQYVRAADCHYGIPYELGATETGENSMDLYNHDGRFDHGNTGSPYSPNVLSYVPGQQLATWNGITYGVFTGYVERWPQAWDDVLTGISSTTWVDAWGAMARTKLHSCMQHEVLMDQPWGYWPLNDASKSRYAANLALNGAGNQTVLYVQPPRHTTDATADFGVAARLAGDVNTCWGTQAPTPKHDAGWSLYSRVTGTALPLPSSGGISVDLWAEIPFQPQRNDEMTLFYLKSSAVAWPSHIIFGLQVNQSNASPGSTVGNLILEWYDGSGGDHWIDLGTRSYADGRWHHFAVTATTTSLTVYADGQQVYQNNSATMSSAQPDTIDVAARQDDWEAVDTAIGSFAHVAIYPGILNASRVASHYQSGHDGFVETTGSRIQRLLTYGGYNGPRVIEQGDSLMGPCATIDGQWLTDAVNDCMTSEQGLAYPDGIGRIRFQARSSRFNKPILGTFGDGPGEFHYQDGIVFDYDPTYQYNDISGQRVTTDGSTGQVFYSQDPSNTKQQYFTNTLQLSFLLHADPQVQDMVAFLYALYSVPQPRVQTMVLHPSEDNTLWPVVLGLQIGDRYLVKRRPQGRSDTITLDVIICEIAHRIQPGLWETTVGFLPSVFPTVTSFSAGPWQLDDPVNSVLGSTTILGA